MNEVIRFHPDTRLIICGTGPLLDELKGVARSAGVERHVTFAGLIDNSAIAHYCAAADLFVLPRSSKHCRRWRWKRWRPAHRCCRATTLAAWS